MSSALAARPATRYQPNLDSMSFVDYESLHPGQYADIAFPADGLVAMMDRLMFGVQASVRPTVTMSFYDCWLYRRITMRWGNQHSQLQLTAWIGDRRGIHLTLSPFWFERGDNRNGSADLASWMLHRSTWGWDYGDLKIYRLSKWGTNHRNTEHVELQCNDPALNSVPDEHRTSFYGDFRPELSTDLITVTQQWLDVAGIR